MTQTERIKAEIERRWKELADKNVKAGGNIYDCGIEQLLSLLSFIESLEQEPISTEETELNSLAFLEQMGYTCISDGSPKIKGWVARDGTVRRIDVGRLRFFDNKPFRRDYITTVNGEWGEHRDYPCKYIINLPKDLFPDLSWEDEPIEVELTLNRI